MDTYLSNLRTYFKNLVLNAVGADRDLYRLLQDRDIDKAIEMMQNRDDEVDKAIAEYNTQTHRVMFRPNKRRKNQPDYVTEKLPRNRQQYINEVELFFLLGNPIKWKKDQWGDDASYKLFMQFIKESHFNARMRQAKRIAGAETECAKLYRVYREGTEIRADIVVLARSTGYTLRPLFDQYGNMLAFACGYMIKGGDGNNTQHWDIYTPHIIFNCKKAAVGWDVSSYRNILDKIPVIYYRQLKAWDGAVPRIEREEHLDSKTADTNNYFADPIAKATADVIESLADPDDTGKMIQLRGVGSSFDYINPPQSSATREGEKRDLNDSILFDTFTPDLSFENMRGLGSVSGVAIKNAMILGYIKRDNRLEIYEEMTEREKSIILEILCLQYPGQTEQIRELKQAMTFEFSEPFASDDRDYKMMVQSLYGSGLVSLENAVHLINLTDSPNEEIERIRLNQKEQDERQLEMQKQQAALQAGGEGGAAPEQQDTPESPESAVKEKDRQEKEAQEYADKQLNDKNPATANKLFDE